MFVNVLNPINHFVTCPSSPPFTLFVSLGNVKKKYSKKKKKIRKSNLARQRGKKLPRAFQNSSIFKKEDRKTILGPPKKRETKPTVINNNS